MTKRIIVLILAAILCTALSVAAFASDGIGIALTERLNDSADILTDAEEAELLAKLDRITDEFKVEIAVATVNGTGDMTATEYVEYYFDNSSLGIGDERDAVLFLIDMEAREFRILSNGRNLGAAAISADDIDSITDKVSSDLKSGNYAKALHKFADECEYQINGEINGFPFKTGRNLVISVVIGLIVALIVTGNMKSKLKTVRWQDKASSYVKSGSLALTQSNDTFLYSRVTRTKRETDSSSGSSSNRSSSRNVGGGSF